MRFQHPTNGFTKSFPIPHLSYFFFGILYLFAFGMWKHALIVLVTGGLAHLYYIFAIGGVVRAHYLEQGWLEA